MYILFFLLELINIYVFFNVALKSVTWFTTSVQVPTLNYLNNLVNFPTKYLLLPRLNIETTDDMTTSDDTTSDDTSDDDTSDSSSDDDMTEEDTSDSSSDDDRTEEDTSDSSSDDTTEEVTKVSSSSDLLSSFPKSDSSDSEDEVKHLSVKPSVIIMDEKLD
jgi:hypothetical protein